MPSPVRAVVFDLDGTLIDTEGVFQEASRLVVEARGVTHDPLFLGTVMGMPGRDALPVFQAHYRLADPLEEIARDYAAAFYRVLVTDTAPLMPGAVELLDHLAERGLPLAIATSSSREYVDKVFAPHGLLARVRFTLTCDDITNGKPHPEIYTLACARLELPPSEVVVVEDSANGLQSAQAAGCRCVIVPHEHTPRARVASAELIVDSLASHELRSWLDSQV